MEKPESLEEQAAMSDDPPEFQPEEQEREVAYAPDGYAVCPSCGHHTSAFCGSCTFMIPVVDGDGYIVGVTYCGCDCMVALGGKSLQETVAGWFDREQTDGLCCYADRNEGRDMSTVTPTRAELEKLAVKWEPCPRCGQPAGVWCKKNKRPIGSTGLVTPGTRMKGVHAERIFKLGADYFVKCCGTWTHANGGTCPGCGTRFEVVADAKAD